MKTRSSPKSALAAQRKQSLIEAAIEEIAATGLSGATLSKIAARAGLAAGAVNFYFDTKESLIYEAMHHLASELTDSITCAIANARQDSAPERLVRLIEANIDNRVATPEKIAAWYFFGANAYHSEEMRVIIDKAEQLQLELIYAECEEILVRGGKQDQMDALAMATSIAALVDGIWDRIQHSGNSYTALEAQNIYMAFLGSVFPWDFELPRNLESAEGKIDAAVKFTIRRADLSDLKQLRQLFIKCHLLHGQEYNKEASRAYLRDELERKETIFFVAIDANGDVTGYAQLCERWCPRSQATIWHLYEFYTEPDSDQAGAEAALLNALTNDAKDNGVSRIDTEVAFNDSVTQQLYQSKGYQRDTAHKKLSLILSQDSQ